MAPPFVWAVCGLYMDCIWLYMDVYALYMDVYGFIWTVYALAGLEGVRWFEEETRGAQRVEQFRKLGCVDGHVEKGAAAAAGADCTARAHRSSTTRSGSVEIDPSSGLDSQGGELTTSIAAERGPVKRTRRSAPW